jgi:hypothetical protein
MGDASGQQSQLRQTLLLRNARALAQIPDRFDQIAGFFRADFHQHRMHFGGILAAVAAAMAMARLQCRADLFQFGPRADEQAGRTGRIAAMAGGIARAPLNRGKRLADLLAESAIGQHDLEIGNADHAHVIGQAVEDLL